MEETSDFNGDGSRGLYKCTKDRLQKIREMCKCILRQCDSILGEEIAENIPPSSCENKPCTPATSTKLKASSSSTYTSTPSPVNPPKDKSVADCKHILNQYNIAFSFPLKAFGDDAPEEVREIYLLLQDWFRTRFYTSMRRDCDFRYNLNQIPKWISHIVLTACQAYKSGNFEVYKDAFNLWLTDLKQTSHHYSLPSKVYFPMREFSYSGTKYMCGNAYWIYTSLYEKVFEGLVTKYGSCSLVHPDDFAITYIDQTEILRASKYAKLYEEQPYPIIIRNREDYMYGEN